MAPYGWSLMPSPAGSSRPLSGSNLELSLERSQYRSCNSSSMPSSNMQHPRQSFEKRSAHIVSLAQYPRDDPHVDIPDPRVQPQRSQRDRYDAMTSIEDFASQRANAGHKDKPTLVSPVITIDGVKVAGGEPLVQDFQTRFPPKDGDADSPTDSAFPQAAQSAHTLFLSSDDETAPPPPDFTRRGIHIPSRRSSTEKKRRRKDHLSGSSAPTTPESRLNSSADSVISYETTASSVRTLPPLQAKANLEEAGRLEPLLEDDPRSFDLLAPSEEYESKGFSIEKRAEQLFGREHLQTIFADSSLLLKFTSFLSVARPKSVPLLVYYLDALKALRAIGYANAVAEALEPITGHDFTERPAAPTVNSDLEEKARQAFDVLVREELPAYITHVFIQTVSVSIQRRIIGTLPPHLREASEGLAEVFCLTDPSRPDNPIVFASEEFHKTTQYGVSYAIGRNCRFLQGPRTNPSSVRRLSEACRARRETSEVFLNYRRDGSPFMNLLMIAPLLDSRGNLRYFIGAQVDVSGLVRECSDLPGLQRIVAKQEMGSIAEEDEKKDEFQELCEMFNMAELETARKHGGRMHHEHMDHDESMLNGHRPRLLLKDPSQDFIKTTTATTKTHGKLEGVYQHYLLLRPYPSLRILFTSPSLRVPGILQSPFLSRIGGSSRVRDELTAALAEGRGVTAKVRWISGRQDEEGRPRWVHCTPLLGHTGAVGVWMVVLVDDEGSAPGGGRRFRMAPPVASDIGHHQAQARQQDFGGRVALRPGAGAPGGAGGTRTKLVVRESLDGERSETGMSTRLPDSPERGGDSLNSFAL